MTDEKTAVINITFPDPEFGQAISRVIDNYKGLSIRKRVVVLDKLEGLINW